MPIPIAYIARRAAGVTDRWSRIASRYVEQFDLLTPQEFAARNEARGEADQKQLAHSAFDEEILSRARASLVSRTRTSVTRRPCSACFASSGLGTIRFSTSWITRSTRASGRLDLWELPPLPIGLSR